MAFSVASSDEWQWEENADAAVAAVFMQFADPEMREPLFATMFRRLRSGSVPVLQGYNPKQREHKTGRPAVLSHLYTADLSRDAFASLQTIDLVEYEADLTEGARHAGRSALVRFVTRKP